MRNLLLSFASLLALSGSALAQTVPTMTRTGQTTGRVPPAGLPVLTDQDVAREIGKKADSTRLDQEISRATTVEAQIRALITASSGGTTTNAVTQTQFSEYNAAIQAQLTQKIEISRIGAANGVAPLDATGKLPIDRIGGVQADAIVWSVCGNNCTFNHPLAAWEAARAYTAFSPFSSITIHIGDGTYDCDRAFQTEEQGTSTIRMIGNIGNPSAVLLRFVNIKNNNGMGFMAMNGGRIGSQGAPGVTGVWIQGVGAQITRSSWEPQSFGAGAFSAGSGSNIHMGAVRISNFYYSVLADEGGRYTGEAGSLYQFAGDVNLLARHGSVIHCLQCTAQTAADIRGAEGTFGFNFMSEAGSAVYVDGSTGTDAQVACFAAQTSASMWAHDVQASNCQQAGGRATQGAFAEFTRAKFYNSSIGIFALSGGSVSVDGAELFSNTYDGLYVNGAKAYGNALNSHNNGGWGVKAERAAHVELYGTLNLLLNNAAGKLFNETGVPGNGTPCPTINDQCITPSYMVVTP